MRQLLVIIFLTLAYVYKPFSTSDTLYAACHCTSEKHCGCMQGQKCLCDESDDRLEPPLRSSTSYKYQPQYDGTGGRNCLYEPPLRPINSIPNPTDVDDAPDAMPSIDKQEHRYDMPTFISDDRRHDWSSDITGGWLPERPPLFRPFIADPRELTFSIGWRFNDSALTKNVIDVSYFDSFPFYGWCNAWYLGDKLQIDLEGALWAVFDPCTYSAPLMNADYYVGIPITYAYGPWSTRLRFFHISSHVGDEYLLNHPGFDRRNPSAEYVDWFFSYQHSDDLRFYGGLGWVIQQDDSFRCGRFYAEAGTEVRVCSLGWHDRWNRLYAVPFLAIHLRHKQDFKRHIDATYALGYEIGKSSGLERRLRLYLEYHDGYSLEGQWSCKPTSYLSIRAQYGF